MIWYVTQLLILILLWIFWNQYFHQSCVTDNFVQAAPMLRVAASKHLNTSFSFKTNEMRNEDLRIEIITESRFILWYHSFIKLDNFYLLLIENYTRTMLCCPLTYKSSHWNGGERKIFILGYSIVKFLWIVCHHHIFMTWVHCIVCMMYICVNVSISPMSPLQCTPVHT